MTGLKSALELERGLVLLGEVESQESAYAAVGTVGKSQNRTKLLDHVFSIASVNVLPR